MLPFFLIVFGVALFVLALQWIPGLREKMRGWTTLIQGTAVATLPLLGNLLDAIDGTNWQSFIPKDWWPYFIVALGIWTVVQRLKTKGPVGRK